MAKKARPIPKRGDFPLGIRHEPMRCRHTFDETKNIIASPPETKNIFHIWMLSFQLVKIIFLFSPPRHLPTSKKMLRRIRSENSEYPIFCP